MLTINTYSNVVKLLGVLVLSWNELEAKLSTTSFSKAVDFLINLISPVCSKAASVQIFISEYRGLALFLKMGEQSYLGRLLLPRLNTKLQ